MNGNLEAELLGASDLILTLGLDAKDFFNGAWRYSAPVVAINESPTRSASRHARQLLGSTSAMVSAAGTE